MATRSGRNYIMDQELPSGNGTRPKKSPQQEASSSLPQSAEDGAHAPHTPQDTAGAPERDLSLPPPLDEPGTSAHNTEPSDDEVISLTEAIQRLNTNMANIHGCVTKLSANHRVTHDTLLTLGKYVKSQMPETQKDTAGPPPPMAAAASPTPTPETVGRTPAPVSTPTPETVGRTSAPVPASTPETVERNPTPMGVLPASALPRGLSFGATAQESVTAFLTKLERHCRFSGLQDIHKAQMFALLLHGIALKWFDSLPPSVQDNWELLKAKCLSKFGPEAHIGARYATLLNYQQEVSQSVENYTEEILRRFQLCTVSESRQLDDYIRGLLPDIRVYVWEKNPQSFTDAVTHARVAEAMNNLRAPSAQLAAATQGLTGGAEQQPRSHSPASRTTAKTSSPPHRGRNHQNLTQQSRTTQGKPRCQRCGEVGHYTNACRTDTRPRCSNCHRMGHLARECRSAPRPWCTFCERAGHTYASCRTRERQSRPPPTRYTQGPTQYPTQGNY